MRRKRRAIQQKKKLTRRHGDTERGHPPAGQLKSEELREKSVGFPVLPRKERKPWLPRSAKHWQNAVEGRDGK